MKKLLLPLSVFVLGLVIAQMFFDIDVRSMFDGSVKFILSLLRGKGE